MLYITSPHIGISEAVGIAASYPVIGLSKNRSLLSTFGAGKRIFKRRPRYCTSKPNKIQDEHERSHQFGISPGLESGFV
jgi:hypothetical protein